MSKYPSRFLFEISDNLFVRQGSLSDELIKEAKDQIEQNSNKRKIQKQFKVGDIVTHPVWKEGVIKELNEEKGEYLIDFPDIGKVKPIIFEYKGLSKSKNENSKFDNDQKKEQVEENLNDFDKAKPETENSFLSKIKKWLS